MFPSRLRFRFLILRDFLKVIVASPFTRVIDIFDFFRVTIDNLLPHRKPTAFYPTTYRDCLVRCSGLWYFCRALADDLYHVQPSYEKRIKHSILNALHDADIFIDVGANIGSFTLTAAKKVGPRGLVVAVEPIPENYALLRRNTGANNFRNVLILQKAAHSRTENLTLYFDQYYTGSSSVHRFRSRTEPVTVPAVTLDTLVNSILNSKRPIAAVKIDVEGSENEVVKGASRTLARTRFLVVEVHAESSQLRQRLSSLGFACKRVKIGYQSYLIGNHAVIPDL